MIVVKANADESIEAEWRLFPSINYAIVGSDNDMSPVSYQAIIWTDDGILLIKSLERNGSQLWFKMRQISY